MSHLINARSTFRDQWPAKLARLSMPDEIVAIEPGEGSLMVTCMDQGYRPGSLDALAARLDAAIRRRPMGEAFVKLTSRSPKDSWNALRPRGPGFKVRDGAAAVALLCDSERVLEDLVLAGDTVPLGICVRDWLEIPELAEFRCFMRERKLVGISQYFCEREFPEIVQDPHYWKQRIHEFFPQFAAACHLDTVIFDIAVLLKRVVLIEINPLDDNPFGTNPCLFEEEKLDGSFRYVGDGRSKPIPLPPDFDSVLRSATDET